MNTTPSIALIPSGYKASKLYSVLPTDGSGDLDVVRATTATRVNQEGLIENVLSNVPRLDYSDGGCPSLLVEPQRTNLLLQSEGISTSPWTLIRSTVTTNNINSPSGTLTGDELIANVTGSNGSWTRQIVSAITGAFSISIYAKQGTSPFLQVRLDGLGAVIFDLSNGTIKASSVVVGSIDSIGSDGWYRCTISGTATGQTVALFIVGNASMTLATWFSTNGDSVYLWGAQLELGSNATSYIPTVASTVTRNADVISKTGISSLIGQSEGTIIAEVDLKNTDPTVFRRILNLSDNTVDNRINLLVSSPTNLIQLQIVTAGVTEANIVSSFAYSGIVKIAIGYATNNLAIYINGIQIGTDASVNIPACSKLNLGADYLGAQLLNDRINSLIIEKTRRTNAELETLTSYTSFEEMALALDYTIEITL